MHISIGSLVAAADQYNITSSKAFGFHEIRGRVNEYGPLLAF